MRIGIIGTESSHADHMIRYINLENRFPGWRVTVVSGDDPVRNRDIARAGSVATATTDFRKLVGEVDAVLVTDRDAAKHRRHATPFLERGVPVFVDKPLATSVSDAEAMLDAATHGGALLTSFSAIRWTDEVAVAARALSGRPPRSIRMGGPAYADSEYSGICFYGSHPADVVCHLTPGHPTGLVATRSGTAVSVRATIGTTAVVLDLAGPEDDGSMPAHSLHVVGPDGVEVGGPIDVPEDYLLPGMDIFHEMVRSGQAPLSHSELLRPVEFLEQITRALSRR